jgi:hypothetical protein
MGVVCGWSVNLQDYFKKEKNFKNKNHDQVCWYR